MRDFGPGMLEATAPTIDRLRFQESMTALPEAIRAMPQPVIAAVNGACVGAGLALCLAADIRICSTAASFGNAAILLGLSGAEMGMSYHLPRIVGTSVAADWMLTGRMVAAEEADRRGLVSETVDPERLLHRAVELGALIARLAPLGVQLTKRALQVNTDASGLSSAMELENRNQVLAHATDEAAARRQRWSVGDPRVDAGWFLVNADPATYRRVTPYSGAIPSPAELAVVYAAYAACKGALLALSNVSAFELAEHGITVNTILPGSVFTPGSMGSRGPEFEGPAMRQSPFGHVESYFLGASRADTHARGAGGWSVDDDGVLVFGDGPGRLLLIADPLQLLEGLVEAGPQSLARRERGGQVFHALDHADALVVLGALGVADVVGHPLEHRGKH